MTKAKENAARKAKQERERLSANLDRLMLYAFVGLPMPEAEAYEYSQPFRLTGNYYSTTVDINKEGAKLLIERVHQILNSVEMPVEKPDLRIVPLED
jgi:predicted amidohydrolase